MEFDRRTVLAGMSLLLGGQVGTQSAVGRDDTETSYPPAGLEVVNPADGYETLQRVLDEYGSEPVTVLLTAGTLTVDTNVRVPSNTWLRGVGRGTVITLADGASLDVAGIVRVPDGTTAVRFSDLVIDGNRENVTNQGKEYGFFTKDANRVLCERVITRNCPGYGFDPHAAGKWETTINLRLLHCGAFNNGKDGITLAGVEESVVDSCLTRNNDRHGVNVTDPDCRCITVSNTVSLHNGGAGIVVQNDPRFVSIANNQVTKNGRAGVKVATTEQSASHCTITGNVIRRNGRYGISVLSGHNVAIVGNALRANTLSGGAAEVKLDAGDDWGANRCLIVANTVHATEADYGIEERVTDRRPNLFVGNVLDGNVESHINRGNPESVAAFNTGTAFRAAGTVTVDATARRAQLSNLPSGSISHADVQVTPGGPLDAATNYWVEETDGDYAVVLDSEPSQKVPFHYAVDSR